jgi:hypothetical protein
MQDQRVWDVLTQRVAAKGPGASVIFISAYYANMMKQQQLEDTAAIAFRPGSQEILESPFLGFWWEAQYAIVVSKASFAAYRWEDVDADHVRLFGNGANGLPPRVVNKSSIVVLFDERPDPKAARDPRGVTTYDDWGKFTEAAKRLF